MAGNYAQPQQPDSINISQDRRTWSEVCPDEYFSLESVGTREFTLHIVAVMQEKIGDKMKAVLRFSNDPRGLVLNKSNRDTLAKLFGDSPADVIGKMIRIGMGFINRNPSLVIKGAVTGVPQGQDAQGAAQAAVQATAAPSVSPDMLAKIAEFMAQQSGGN
jgi:hypothetical protein